jgi:hypothetical protein
MNLTCVARVFSVRNTITDLVASTLESVQAFALARDWRVGRRRPDTIRLHVKDGKAVIRQG